MNKDYCVWDVMPCGLVVINPVNGSSINLTNYGTRVLDLTTLLAVVIFASITASHPSKKWVLYRIQLKYILFNSRKINSNPFPSKHTA